MGFGGKCWVVCVLQEVKLIVNFSKFNSLRGDDGSS